MQPIVMKSEGYRWDSLSLGEVMLRLDPGESRVHTARHFTAWEGGGEYNVARGLRRCFGLRTGIVTALADNPVGRLVEDFILQGGVDTSLIRWVPYDGVGRTVRNGLNLPSGASASALLRAVPIADTRRSRRSREATLTGRKSSVRRTVRAGSTLEESSRLFRSRRYWSHRTQWMRRESMGRPSPMT